MSTTTSDQHTIPALRDAVFVTDGGLETTLVFHEGIDLPDFAAFPLLETADGRAALRRYYEPYFDIAARAGTGIVLDTPTWRANPDWAARQGLDDERLHDVNVRAVDFIRELAAERDVTSILNGVIGPRGDGYVVGETMSPAEARNYHAVQARAFAEAGVDVVTAVTMTYVDEAVGVADAVAAVGLPSVVSFTVETDGVLPSGETLGDAVHRTDAASTTPPAHFMVNCAHPSHFVDELRSKAGWTARIGGIRANASRMSHEELDAAEELDRGDVGELAADYRALAELLPGLRVVGGCCGTDHEHIGAIFTTLGR